MQAELGVVNGGLRGSRELQGGRMLITRRPHVAKFMFIWAARRKSFPGWQRWKLIGRILCFFLPTRTKLRHDDFTSLTGKTAVFLTGLDLEEQF